jgi:hypothetical protein
MTDQHESTRVHWVSSNIADNVRFLGISLLAITIWAVGMPLAFFAAGQGSGPAGTGLFVASCAVGLVLWVSTFTTVDRLRALASGLPEVISDMAFSRNFQANPWFAFAFLFTAVHIGIIVGHGIVLLG